MYGVECRGERRSHSSIFKINDFECRAECRTRSSIYNVCMVFNAELNIGPTARIQDECFSNAKLNVEPIARYSMQS